MTAGLAISSFNLGEGGFVLVLVRWAAVATLLSGFGSITFRSLVAPAALARMDARTAATMERRLLGLAKLSFLLQAAALLGWLALEAGVMAGAGNATQEFNAVPAVLSDTLFGHVIVLQLIALTAVLTLLARWPLSAVAVGALATALQAGHSHSYAMHEGLSLLLVSEVAHLLAAGAWLGGLLPLMLVVRTTAPEASAAACQAFSPLGMWCVAVLAVTAALQFSNLIGSLFGLFHTPYGWMALAKFAMFAMLLGFAALNRYRLAPGLLRCGAVRARRGLVRSIAAETVIGIAIVLAAAVLSELPPAIHTHRGGFAPTATHPMEGPHG